MTGKGPRGAYGYNAVIGEFGDMLEEGMLDPSKVTRACAAECCIHCRPLLTTEVMVAAAPKDDGRSPCAAPRPPQAMQRKPRGLLRFIRGIWHAVRAPAHTHTASGRATELALTREASSSSNPTMQPHSSSHSFRRAHSRLVLSVRRGASCNSGLDSNAARRR